MDADSQPIRRLVMHFTHVENLPGVHWTATRETPGAGLAALTTAVRAWSPRKERLFTEYHVSVAVDRLRSLSWCDVTR